MYESSGVSLSQLTKYVVSIRDTEEKKKWIFIDFQISSKSKKLYSLARSSLFHVLIGMAGAGIQFLNDCTI